MSGAVVIRAPEEKDISGIIDVAKACEPLIRAYIPYYYWINIHYWGKTCAIAADARGVGGWCSLLGVGENRYFLHQLGVLPRLRGQGLAARLVTHALMGVTNIRQAEIELTIERNNAASLALFRKIADKTGLALEKRPETPGLLEKEYNEDLYVMRAL